MLVTAYCAVLTTVFDRPRATCPVAQRRHRGAAQIPVPGGLFDVCASTARLPPPVRRRDRHRRRSPRAAAASPARPSGHSPRRHTARSRPSRRLGVGLPTRHRTYPRRDARPSLHQPCSGSRSALDVVLCPLVCAHGQWAQRGVERPCAHGWALRGAFARCSAGAVRPGRPPAARQRSVSGGPQTLRDPRPPPPRPPAHFPPRAARGASYAGARATKKLGETGGREENPELGPQQKGPADRI